MDEPDQESHVGTRRRIRPDGVLPAWLNGCWRSTRELVLSAIAGGGAWTSTATLASWTGHPIEGQWLLALLVGVVGGVSMVRALRRLR